LGHILKLLKLGDLVKAERPRRDPVTRLIDAHPQHGLELPYGFAIEAGFVVLHEFVVAVRSRETFSQVGRLESGKISL
jgi:hypothetical protein